MFKSDYINAINEALLSVQRETKALFSEGSEEEILLEIEKQRKIYLWLKERSKEIAKERRLKKIKEWNEKQDRKGLSPVDPDKRLLEKKRSRKTQTKEEKLESAFANLGLDPVEMKKRIAQASKGK